MNWEQLCDDKALQDLPYKIELNRRGQIIMSPARYKHGYFQTEIAFKLKSLLPDGFVVTECAIETEDGTKVADATWSSRPRFVQNKEVFSCMIAPEICVEVMSPNNDWAEMREKARLYLGKGAIEVWISDELGQLKFFDQSGELSHSKLCPEFPNKIA